ncbi:MAG: MetQ/NlpA family ABC transporter substrate-binding protein [Eggerthellales bacterium]|nr:MetQ/NlpA family ABC transporter substrate-binding protein [Eggerthellales bacterium]
MFKNVKTKALVALGASAALAGALALSACGSASSESCYDDETTIRIAASPTPHAQILNDVVVPQLEEQGYTVEVIEFEDYVQPNTVVEQEEVDANYFQHINYLDSFNAENGTNLASVGYVHYEPFGLYAGKSKSLDNIQEGAIIAVPDDSTNEARALLLLEQEGLITLAEGAGVTATVADIVDNPLNLQIQEVEAAQVPHVLADVDFGVINGNYALQAGLNVADALAVESTTGAAAQQYGNILAVKAGHENDPKIQDLYAALTSPEVAEYIQDNYNGAVVALF